MLRGTGTKAGVAALAGMMLVLTGVVGAPAAYAEDDVTWIRGPYVAEVSISMDEATAGFDADDIRDVIAYNPRCYAGPEVPSSWTGDSGGGTARAYVDDYSGPGVNCSIDVHVTYCYWAFLRYCDGDHYVTLWGTTGPLHVDSTPPINTGFHVSETTPNAAGWYRTPGRVDWAGYDAASGIGPCAANRIGPPDTAAGSMIGACADIVGNLSPNTTFTFKYDATPPVLSPTASAPVLIGAAVKGDPGATDATSGIASAQCNGGADLPTATLGSHTVVCTATDRAGNTAAADLTYTVMSESATSVVLSASTFRFGATGTATATATLAVDAGPLAGEVAFLVDGSPAGTAPVVNGAATTTLTLPGGLSAGAHEVEAHYLGSATALPSAGAASFSVVAATSTTALSAPPVHNNKQTPAKLTAKVQVEGGLPAVGTVEFWDGATAIGSTSVSNGSAVLTLGSSMSRGTHRFKAVFTPAAVGDILGSTSNVVSVLVPR
jgi:hypothetical protein